MLAAYPVHLIPMGFAQPAFLDTIWTAEVVKSAIQTVKLVSMEQRAVVVLIITLCKVINAIHALLYAQLVL